MPRRWVPAVLTAAVLGALVLPASTANAAPTLLSQGRPTTASSTEGPAWAAANAVDGDAGTRWASLAADPQWLQVDLGSTATLSSVVLRWEAAYATAFQLQVSADGTSWTSVHSTTTSAGGTQTIPVTGSGRYVRMLGTTRATGYGYSLWEFQVYGETGGQPPVDPPGNWTTVWSDDFSGAAGAAPSAANWLTRTGTQYPGGAANWGTGSVETAAAANVRLDGSGHLAITANRDGAGRWTSGRIETQRADFAAPLGAQVRFTAVLKQPDVADGTGYWPGFRATGTAYRGNWNNWPTVGETDIMTDVNGRGQLSQTLHCGTAPAGACNEYDGRTSGLASCAGCKTGYHEYSQVIDRTKTDEEIRFYLDGRQTWVVRQSQVGVTAWRAAVQHGFYLRLDLAIGGSLPNAVAGFTTPTPSTTSGGVLSVDSVSVATTAAGGGAPAPMTDPATPAGPSVVRVTGTRGNWQLQVNGAPWQVKGMTYGPPQAAADGYLRDLRTMGVNTVRTWAVDDADTPTLLDRAAQQGQKVIVGHWLNHGADYVNDTAYKNSVKAEIVARVNTLKNRQGVLMWDLGNEVLLTMQDHGLAADVVQARRVAYARFVNEVALAVKAADPNHPVTSTDAWQVSGFGSAWSYYKQHTPALDLYAINAYGGTPQTYQTWLDEGLTKPYVITESGPYGEWEVPNDVNGIPTEPTDVQKRDGYLASWGTVTAHPGVVLGATEFHYGLENDFGGVWLNTYPSGWRRLSYHALTQAYSGRALPNTPPVISSMTVGSQTAVPAGGTFTVNATVSDPNGDLLRYNLMASDKHITGNRGLSHLRFTETGPGAFRVTAPQTLGVWKVYVYAYDGHGNVGIETRSFRVVPPPVSGTDVALNRPTTASSYQPTGPSGPQPPGLATDGDLGTRWASDWSDPQWIQVDTGSVGAVRTVQLVWESAYARAYRIEVSNDGAAWTTAWSTTTGDGGVDTVALTASGRYVRVTGTQRGTGYGYSLWELGVYR